MDDEGNSPQVVGALSGALVGGIISGGFAYFIDGKEAVTLGERFVAEPLPVLSSARLEDWHYWVKMLLLFYCENL